MGCRGRNAYTDLIISRIGGNYDLLWPTGPAKQASISPNKAYEITYPALFSYAAIVESSIYTAVDLTGTNKHPQALRLTVNLISDRPQISGSQEK